MDTVRIVAGIGAVVHIGFAFAEMARWKSGFAARATKRWTLKTDTTATVGQHIEWSAPLALNVGAYNLALALGLAWVAAKGVAATRALGLFLAVWLLIAAIAAGWTKIYLALAIQGALGLILLFLCLGVIAA